MESTFYLPSIGKPKMMIDTLQYTKQAIAAGFTQQQAEFQAEKMATLVNDEIVTKAYLSKETTLLQQEILMARKDISLQISKATWTLVTGIPAIIGAFTLLYKTFWG